jgi:hypothetical protein
MLMATMTSAAESAGVRARGAARVFHSNGILMETGKDKVCLWQR